MLKWNGFAAVSVAILQLRKCKKRIEEFRRQVIDGGGIEVRVAKLPVNESCAGPVGRPIGVL